MKTILIVLLIFAANISLAGGSGGTMGSSTVKDIRETVKPSISIKEIKEVIKNSK